MLNVAEEFLDVRTKKWATSGEQFIENYSQSYSYRWESMETWTSIPPSAAKKVIDGAKVMDTVRSRPLEDLKRWRDEKLVEFLKILRDD